MIQWSIAIPIFGGIAIFIWIILAARKEAERINNSKKKYR